MALILMEHCVMEKVCLMELCVIIHIYIYLFKQSARLKLGQALVNFLPGVSI
jgi:hypothetical protein